MVDLNLTYIIIIKFELDLFTYGRPFFKPYPVCVASRAYQSILSLLTQMHPWWPWSWLKVFISLLLKVDLLNNTFCFFFFVKARTNRSRLTFDLSRHSQCVVYFLSTRIEYVTRKFTTLTHPAHDVLYILYISIH